MYDLGGVKPAFDIFDFELSNQEMTEIAKLDKGKRYYDTSIEERAKLYRTIIPRD